MELIRPEPHRTSTHVRQFRVLIEDLSLLLPLGKCLSMPALHRAPERSLLVHDCTSHTCDGSRLRIAAEQ